MKLGKVLLYVLLASWVGVCFVWGQAGIDTIQWEDGKKTANVVVKSFDFAQVKYKEGEAEKTAPTSKVSRIDYGDAPSSFKKGMSSYSQGNWARAYDLFDESLSKSKFGARKWLDEYSTFYKAESARWLKEKAKSDEARRLYLDLIKRFPKSSHLVNARIGLAQALSALGKYEEAFGALKELRGNSDLSAALGSAGMSRVGVQIGYEKARMLEMQEDFSGARSAYQEIASSAASSAPTFAAQSRGKVGEMMVRQGDLSGARSYFETIRGEFSRKSSLAPHEGVLLAAALAGLGEVLFAEKKYTEARRVLAVVIVERYDAPEQHAKALYYMGRVHDALKDSEKTAESMAQRYYQRVRSLHSQSEWVSRIP
ncbi:MAG: tetratricopeptide repeat protein [Planctomycetota bacterium]|nr:tetratricopeptide repeat protein [Planctomycetota bacterium]